MLRWMMPFLVAFSRSEPLPPRARVTKPLTAPQQPSLPTARPPPSPTEQPGRRQARRQPAVRRAETRRHQARRLSRRQPIAAGPAPRALQIPDHGCPPQPRYVRRGRRWWSRKSRTCCSRRSDVVPYAPPWTARRCCRAPRRCQAITAGLPTTIRARITAAPMSPTGIACPTPAASTAIANAQRINRRGKATAKDQIRPPPMRSPPISSPCWSR